MSHTSPASYLVWSIITTILQVFLWYHLWSFDRFKCLKWNNGIYSGAFKRVMTYSYLLTMPLISTYGIGFTIIKYMEGFIIIGGKVFPTPYTLWAPMSRAAIFPLMLIFSIGWSFELVTHLEELCFWLFLVNAGSAQQDWFRSPYFKTWAGGSLAAVLYMPLVTIFTRSDVLRMEAYTFLAGSLGSLSLTLWFTPILWTFPAFLAHLKRENVDKGTIVRLTKFHELNTIRICFRFLFTIPMVILGVDGVRPHHHINESMLWTDLLTIVASFGVAISSGITLVIFFPRSVETELAAKEAVRERKRSNRSNLGASVGMTDSHYWKHSIIDSQRGPPSGVYPLTGSPVKQQFSIHSHEDPVVDIRSSHTVTETPQMKQMMTEESWEELDQPTSLSKMPSFRPNRRTDEDVELGGMDRLSERNLSTHNLNLRHSNVNPFIQNFTSPIDLAYSTAHAAPPSDSSRLTFTRR